MNYIKRNFSGDWAEMLLHFLDNQVIKILSFFYVCGMSTGIIELNLFELIVLFASNRVATGFYEIQKQTNN